LLPLNFFFPFRQTAPRLMVSISVFIGMLPALRLHMVARMKPQILAHPVQINFTTGGPFSILSAVEASRKHRNTNAGIA
jgi:hypothetical protein